MEIFSYELSSFWATPVGVLFIANFQGLGREIESEGCLEMKFFREKIKKEEVPKEIFNPYVKCLFF